VQRKLKHVKIKCQGKKRGGGWRGKGREGERLDGREGGEGREMIERRRGGR